MWLLSAALAGDVGVYRSALRLVDEHYLWPERIDHARMFRAAAERLEQRVDPVLVEANEAAARVRVGGRTWNVAYRGDLPSALAQLEDAVVASGVELDARVDLRAELLKGALSTLDRHTVVLAGEGLERFDERLSGTLSGIGVTLRLVDRRLHIVEVYANGPAARAGLRNDDVVVKIEGIRTDGMTPTDATGHIRGRAGTRVHLTVERDGTAFEVELERAEIAIPNVRGEAGPRGVGVVEIDHFSEQTLPNLERVLGELRGQGLLDRGLVLDLRGNTGGSLQQSARAADVFVDAGRIVTTAGRDGEKVPGLMRSYDGHADARAALPAVVVLVDHETASGAEILAGALARLDRAVILGEVTFGKGTVQTLYELAEGLKLKLTVAEYRLADDTRVNEVGLVPDLATYPIEAGTQRFWYPDAQKVRARLGAATPLVTYPDLGRLSERDDPLELAAALLSVGATPTRQGLLDAQSSLLESLTAIQASRVADALAGESLDWSAAPARGTVADVEVVLAPHAPPRAGERAELTFEVKNRGPALHRAAIRLRTVNPDLDDLVVPLGALAAGATRTVRTHLTPSATSPTRADRLVGVLECDGCPPSPVFDEVFAVEGGPPAAVSAVARVAGGGVEVELHNRGEVALGGVRVSIPFPDLPGVDLDAPADHTHTLAPGSTVTVRQGLAAGTAEALDLRLDVRADGYADLARWEFSLPTSGEAVRLDAPTVVVTPPRPRQPPGTANVHVQLQDLDGIAQIVVWAGPERVDRSRWDASVAWEEGKVLWRGDVGRRAALTVAVPIVSGTNRVVVVAEDRAGLRTRRELYIYGDGAPAGDDGVALDP